MRMWKKAIAVAMTACFCLMAPAHTFAQTEENPVATVTKVAEINTVADNTKEVTNLNNKVTTTSVQQKSTVKKVSSVKTASVKKTSKKVSSVKTTSVKKTSKKVSSVKKSSVKKTSKKSRKYLGTFKAYAYNGAGTTASGTTTKANRTVAVDPKVIPLGSKLMINGKIYIAEDTGGFIKGKKIDIFMPSYNDCIQWGVKNVKVYLIK